MPPPLLSLLTTPTFLVAAIIALVLAVSLRLLVVLPPTHFTPPPRRRRPDATRVVVVLGSGGHTSEMFSLLRDLDTRKWMHRTYIVSGGDGFSAGRAVEFESALEERVRAGGDDASTKKGEDGKLMHGKQEQGRPSAEGASGSVAGRATGTEQVGPAHYDIALIPRARRVHQPLLTTPFTALRTLLATFSPLLSSSSPTSDLPDMIITNGPATGVIVVLAAFLLRFLNIRGAQSRGKCRTVYVESFARVTSLSLSGKLLMRLVDRFLVQWEELEGRGAGRAEFWGILV